MNKTILIPAGEVQSSLAYRVSDRLTFNALGNLLLERYFALVRAQIHVIRKTFTEPELQAFLDANNGASWDPIEIGVQSVAQNVEDAIEFEELDGKWGIDGAALVEKLSNLDGLTKLALIEFAEYAWRNAGRLNFGEPYLILADVAGDRR